MMDQSWTNGNVKVELDWAVNDDHSERRDKTAEGFTELRVEGFSLEQRIH